ncbi:glycoside hydrolase [Nonlabens sp. YIK11]|uniref:DUF4861 family protein n=1 Tax=Nonlabens sp. YIK11 TaxID=1453349 RepID=UPI0006DC4C43|nr:DUF4861 family protein [Nonlabens sp. YIK11]KQC32685.1 glycoside hydrolase [Nonlabens sp. YIK11]
MKRILLPAMIILITLSCKREQTEPATHENQETVTASTTYAEISRKEGGYWEGREYMEGNFKNVDTLMVPAEHTDHSWFIRYEGPGWENNQIGYRLYLDWRNAIDIFGKKVDTLVLPYVGQDGFDSYHEEQPWGQDILKAGKSMGIGGYGRILNDTVAHFRNVSNTTAIVENLEGKSIVHINYENWKTGNDSIDLNTQLSILASDRYTKAVLKPSQEIEGLCTGIVKFENVPLSKKEGAKWAYIATYGNQTLVSDDDKLGMALFYRLDQVELQKEGVNDHLVIFKPTTQELTYYFLGAWEQEPNGIKNETDFFTDLDQKLNTLENTNSL